MAVDTPERLARFLCMLEYPAREVERAVTQQFPECPEAAARAHVTRAVAARERTEAAVETEIEREGRDAPA